MASPDPFQKQSIANSSFTDSDTQQSQAGRDALSFQNSSSNQATINNTVVNLFGSREAVSSAPRVDWEWAAQILQQQRVEVRKRLKDTLAQQQARMEVGLEEQPQQVNRSPLAAMRTLSIEGQASQTLKIEQLLIEVFGREDIEGKLLILGTPGAGKTTALLGLTEQLLNGAIANPRTIIPVIFELSTWRNDNQSIRDWLVEQLYDNFGGDCKLKCYEQWLDKRVLLPLIDGLDELGLARQKKCTVKLDEFAQHYPQLVVCCRVKEFKTAEVRLGNLRGALCLQPLSDEQIQTYLQAVNRVELWQQIQATPEMQQMILPTSEGALGLLRVPLFVAMAATVYNQQPFRTKAELLEKYVEEQLSYDKRQRDRRKENRQSTWAFATVAKEPKYLQTRTYLGWLAGQLQRQNQVELLIEQMQPSWLNIPKHKRSYWLAIGLIRALVVGLIAGLMFGLIREPIFGLVSGLVIGLSFGITVGLISDLIVGLDDITPTESFQISLLRTARREILKEFKIGLIAGLVIGLTLGLMFGLVGGLMFGLVFGLIAGLVFGLIVGLVGGLIFRLKVELKVRAQPNQGIRNSFYSMCFVSLFGYPLGVILAAVGPLSGSMARAIREGKSLEAILGIVSQTISVSLIPGIFGALLLGLLAGGGVECIQHLCLRFVLTRAHATPWNYARFLNYCTERRLLQRIGGRYRFIHRELLDHFAGTPPQPLPDAERGF
ncbi:MAG: hypothetical protein KME12_08725 [Trichocoleus desertorum ATA4-8-CV12]|jgi:MFS family permease|nr:hypothetical protein [Trichocoleus desertorum ATA4-8-CV12]